MANTEDRVHISVYVPAKVKRFIHMEAIRRNTYITHIAAEALCFFAKWGRLNEIDKKKKAKLDTHEEETELAEIEKTIKEIDEEIIVNQKRS